jgi:hypothetical protein
MPDSFHFPFHGLQTTGRAYRYETDSGLYETGLPKFLKSERTVSWGLLIRQISGMKFDTKFFDATKLANLERD